ncbi:hypothetical protein DRH29_05780 [candidate division Kazan bacterium]|uniref:Uncharacterized protein n=1 Tax=candidate division Kazan bacterium TaxID=2202143 RepID=A0A420ZB10_UNCK3|nr:MAG: hypothetical protein DRH29_05780 [candidate division Kazan bacterium]
MSFIAGIGAGISQIIGQIQDRVEGIVSTIINFFRNIANNIYVFFLKTGDYFMTNPRGMILFFANVWTLMY